ncbi:MAG: substrate-binding domain-containing protein [Synergistaceae bacterium]|jgi:phosphate transport system substrate-binding protein|nr:substrate-binding domain-containing protein [Synergistaceae bacterium]
MKSMNIMNMKKATGVLLSLVMVVSLLAGCGYAATAQGRAAAFDRTQDIGVVSREDGSGTRGAFIELFGIEVRNADGTRKDMTTKEAVIANQTNVMMINIAGNKYGIGYISLGSLNQTVKALDIGGVKATVENVKNGTYTIARPFNIATKGEAAGLAKDFIAFILSAEGQAIVAQGYIAVGDNPPAYSGGKSAGKIVVSGSSSVTPVMERLKEAYITLNPNAAVEIQQSDSSAGLNDAITGVCDIAMTSRELRASELEVLSSIQIALDGIAVIANNQNPLTNLTQDQIKSIFTGEATRWSDLPQLSKRQ